MMVFSYPEPTFEGVPCIKLSKLATAVIWYTTVSCACVRMSYLQYWYCTDDMDRT